LLSLSSSSSGLLETLCSDVAGGEFGCENIDFNARYINAGALNLEIEKCNLLRPGNPATYTAAFR